MTHTDEQTWLATFGAADADAAWLLCDRHDPDAIAFTLVEADLAGRDLSFGSWRTGPAGWPRSWPPTGSRPVTGWRY